MRSLGIVLLLLAAAAPAAAADLLLRHGTVYTFDNGVRRDCDVLIEKGRITRIGPNLANEKHIREIALGGRHVIPGIIDAHTHVGLAGEMNEGSENVTPEIDMADQLNPDDPAIYYCLSGGVTMVHSMHGSANPIGGRNIVLKLKWGREAEELVERRAPRTLKMALGENPKGAGGGRFFPTSRNGVALVIRHAFQEAREYRRVWAEYRAAQAAKKQVPPPRRDLRLEALLEVLDGKLPVRCHAYRAEEALELMRIAKEFGFRIQAFEHLHQAYRMADELAAAGIALAGFTDFWNYKLEAAEYTPFGYQLLFAKGVPVSLTSDGGEVQRRLYMEAGKMRRYAGLDDMAALATITLNPARLLGVDAHTGSIAVGKDADLAVFDGPPLSSMSKCVLTLIEGDIYFDREQDVNARRAAAAPTAEEIK